MPTGPHGPDDGGYHDTTRTPEPTADMYRRTSWCCCGGRVKYDLSRRVDVHVVSGTIPGASAEVAARHRWDASVTSEEMLYDRKRVSHAFMDDGRGFCKRADAWVGGGRAAPCGLPAAVAAHGHVLGITASAAFPCRSCKATFHTAAERHAHEDEVPHGAAADLTYGHRYFPDAEGACLARLSDGLVCGSRRFDAEIHSVSHENRCSVGRCTWGEFDCPVRVAGQLSGVDAVWLATVMGRPVEDAASWLEGMRNAAMAMMARDDGLCGAVADWRAMGLFRPQRPCRKPDGHERGPDTDFKREWHSNGQWSWPVGPPS